MDAHENNLKWNKERVVYFCAEMTWKFVVVAFKLFACRTHGIFYDFKKYVMKLGWNVRERKIEIPYDLDVGCVTVLVHTQAFGYMGATKVRARNIEVKTNSNIQKLMQGKRTLLYSRHCLI
jgi:hypothetical protein